MNETKRPGARADERAKRQGEALRANLQRRKQQARGRRAEERVGQAESDMSEERKERTER